jgi:hypothetical protein
MVAEDRDDFIESIASELREPVRFGADFDGRVMASLDADVIPLRPMRARSRSWFTRPRLVAVTPLAGLAAAAAITAIIVFGARAVATGGSPAPVAATESAVNPVILAANTGRVTTPALPTPFIYQDASARSVALVGDFNDWDAARSPLVEVSPGVWSLTLALEPGRYQYQLVIDGQRRIADPSAQQSIDSEFGGTNSVVVVTGALP